MALSTWLGTLSIARVVVRSIADEDTWPRVAFRVDPAFAATRPTPDATESFVVEFTVHGPPVSAVPQPAATVRPNASCARAPAGGGADTVTDCVGVAVAPSSSVTVRVTG